MFFKIVFKNRFFRSFFDAVLEFCKICHVIWKKTKLSFCTKRKKVSQFNNFFHFKHFFLFGGLMSVGQRSMKLLSSLRPSLTKFSQDWILRFFWYCTWWQVTVISNDWRSQIVEKKKAAQIWAQWAWIRPAQNEVFCHFLGFGSLVFLKIAYNDSLQQYLTSSRSKTHGKIFDDPNLGQTS